ncbi:acetate uptake transporter [Streptantibioticus rubrisoli]|uniref:Acetate uptake transporter n=1 Tax=Streptantibioticus rubrisoli TaxID=1387313 RepID=A0ABT1P9W5_9ACTN|nr:acetate uptake transporter [Streptantibioticus rubrisoli]MCQ4041130.1 acetate uptake transporter [Streptantibioticus rubrisoli]
MAEANPDSTAQLDQPRQLAPDSTADPGPLGLAGFASTTFVLSCFNANLLDASLSAVVLPLALFYGGLVQLLAGMWEFRRGNTFGATAFGSFGAFWLSFAGYVRFVAPHLPAASAHQATGLYLLVWAVFTVYMTVAALKTNGAVLGVFAFLSLTFVLLSAGEFAQSTVTTKVGGWSGLVTAVVAWYASFAAVTNATWRRSALPTWPRA